MAATPVRDLVGHGADGSSPRDNRSPSSRSAPNVLEREVGRQYAALDTPRNDEFVVHHPIVDMTLTQLIETRLVEFIVHGSDLAQSVGRRDEIDDEMSALAWAAMAPLPGHPGLRFPQQIRSYGTDHFLYGRTVWGRIANLGTIDARPGPGMRTVFLSAGLAGTEVLSADALVQAKQT